MPGEVSVVIPTLNEALRLPVLLNALAGQTQPPLEIIVVDARSTDGTRELAAARGCTVLEGGSPAVGRNAGAAAARGQIILFLDADVRPAPTFLADAVTEFLELGCAVATCEIDPLEEGPSYRVIAEAVNLYLQVARPFSPHAPGFCIFVKREVHASVGGFDEAAVLAEDHEYVQRASKLGEFCVLKSVTIPVSMRRLEKEGLVPLAFKYLWAEMHALAGQPVYWVPFEYEFGSYESSGKDNGVRRLLDGEQLREQLETMENPFRGLSASARRWLDHVASTELRESLRGMLRPPFDRSDLSLLHSYLTRRLEGLSGTTSRRHHRSAAPSDRQE